MADKYEIKYEVYDRYGSGGIKKAVFSAADDWEALKRVCGKLSLYDEPSQICYTAEEKQIKIQELIANGDIEEGTPPEEIRIWTRGEDNPEDVASMLQDCDGQDFIFYIKRPDGSLLYDSGADECDSEDW